MDRILVASDFSTRSDRALRRAVIIARTTGASLSLLHVVDGDRLERVIAREREEALAVLDDTARTLRRDDGITAEPRVITEDVDSGILLAAEETGAGLIIVGPHRTRLRDVFVGTTVERVVRRSRFPLLVAVQPPSAAYDRTLLALDFDEASKAAGRAAMDLGIFEHTRVTVMHAFDAPGRGMMQRGMGVSDLIEDYVADESEHAASELRDLVREIGLPRSDQRIVAVSGTPAQSIQESARRENADLVVLGTNQRKGFERLLIGSVTADVIRDARRDVLIIPTDAD